MLNGEVKHFKASVTTNKRGEFRKEPKCFAVSYLAVVLNEFLRIFWSIYNCIIYVYFLSAYRVFAQQYFKTALFSL